MKQATADKTAAIATLKTTLDDSGNHIASIDPTSAETQLMKVTTGAVAGAAVAIPPMAISIPVSITVGEGVSLASTSFSRDLGLTDNKITAGGPSVSFTASQDVTATNPMTLSIPYGALSFALADVNDENLVVMYRWLDVVNGEPTYEAGVFPGDKVIRGNGKVSFQTTKFGTFQVGIAETKITKNLLVTTEEPPALKSCERYAAAVFPACTADGQIGCVTTEAFKAADMTLAKSDVILTGKTIASVTGNVTLPPPGKVFKGINYGVNATGSTGTLTLPDSKNVLASTESYGDPDSPLTPALPNNGVLDIQSKFPGAGYFTDVVNKPSQGSYTGKLLDVTGTAQLEAHVNCSSSGQQSCVTTSTYQSADVTNLKPENILAGVTIAGTSGNVSLPTSSDVRAGITFGPTNQQSTGSLNPGSGAPPNCSRDNQENCVTTNLFPSVDKNILQQNSNQMLDTLTVAGIPGTIKKRGQWDLTLQFPGPGYYEVIAGIPPAGSYSSTLFGIPGTAPGVCSQNGQQNCVASGNYFAGTACDLDGSNCFLPQYSIPGLQTKKAIDFSSIDPLKMLKSLTVSGIRGTISSLGTWDVKTAFPGDGYYVGISNTPSATSYAGTLFGTLGTANW